MRSKELGISVGISVGINSIELMQRRAFRFDPKSGISVIVLFGSQAENLRGGRRTPVMFSSYTYIKCRKCLAPLSLISNTDFVARKDEA